MYGPHQSLLLYNIDLTFLLSFIKKNKNMIDFHHETTSNSLMFLVLTTQQNSFHFFSIDNHVDIYITDTQDLCPVQQVNCLQENACIFFIKYIGEKMLRSIQRHFIVISV